MTKRTVASLAVEVDELRIQVNALMAQRQPPRRRRPAPTLEGLIKQGKTCNEGTKRYAQVAAQYLAMKNKAVYEAVHNTLENVWVALPTDKARELKARIRAAK